MADVQREITMELLTDIASALRSITRDFLPHTIFTIEAKAGPPQCVVLRVPGATSEPIQVTLKQLAESMRDVTDRTIPSLPLRYTVIGGSEASGIEITVKPGASPVYGHIIKAKPAWLRPSIQPLRADATVRRSLP